MGDQIGAITDLMARQAAKASTEDSATRTERIQHVLKTFARESIAAFGRESVAAAMKALGNMPQVQEPTDSTTREITWPGMNTHYEGNIGNDAHWEFNDTVTTSHTVMDYEDGQIVGMRQFEDNIPVHGEGEIPKEK